MLNIAYTHASVVLVIFRYHMPQNKQSNTYSLYSMTSVVVLFALQSRKCWTKFRFINTLSSAYEIGGTKFIFAVIQDARNYMYICSPSIGNNKPYFNSVLHDYSKILLGYIRVQAKNIII